MPLATDPSILSAVEKVYTTDLGLPDEWTDAQRAAFINDEAETITWMVRAEAATLGDRSIEDWTRRSGGHAPERAVRDTLMARARVEALTSVLNTELYELVPPDDRILTPGVGHAESRKIGGGSEMIDTDGKEKLSRRVQAGRGGAVPRH